MKKSLINLKPIENKNNERSLSTNNFSGMPKISPKNQEGLKINDYFAIKMNAEFTLCFRFGFLRHLAAEFLQRPLQFHLVWTFYEMGTSRKYETAEIMTTMYVTV